MWVVKLGGSLHDAPALRRWLQLAGRRPGACRASSSRAAGRSPTPCGSCSRVLGFDELAAHRMAILAMQQFGLALQALEPSAGAGRDGRRAARGPGGGLAALAPGRARRRRSRPSWDVTSDSLACWLAIRLAAATGWSWSSRHRYRRATHDAASLATAGLLDRAFAGHRAAIIGAASLLSTATPIRGQPLAATRDACRVIG